LIFSKFLFVVFIEDSQGNINPYAMTGYTINYDDKIDHGSFCNENKYKQRNPDISGGILVMKK
jgi:hypothetical protein